MAFFTLDLKAAAKQEGSSQINKSGIYDVTLKNIIVDVNDNGARTLNLYVDHNGTAQVMYGAIRLENNDGSPNFQAGLFSKLAVVCGIENISDPEEATLPIGTDKAAKDVAVLPDFVDIDIKMRVQMEYSIVPDTDKNGKPYAKAGQISEKKVIKGFYTADGASAEEILNETEAGVKLAKDEAYAENVTYKDGLTEETVQAWISSGRGADAPATAGKAVPKATFGKPRFGAK